MRALCHGLFVLLTMLLAPAAVAADWVRSGLNTNQPIWGVRGGLLWAVPPGGFRADTGPRGLLRIGYPIGTNGAYNLVNFIAIEPVVDGRKGFSELETSKLDARPGKRLWAVDGTNTTGGPLVPGQLTRLPSGAEQLDVSLRVEPFDNGAKVRLTVSQRSDAPEEIRLTLHAESDSAPLEYCIVTATMGNLARTRQLWLKDEMVHSQKLYPKFDGDHFTPHTTYPLDRLTRTAQGDIIAAVTTDEADSAAVFPFPGTRRWHFGGGPVTQYWKQSSAAVRDDLHVAVNARYTYWMSRRPIPGGVSFENFEMRERFYDGQTFTFGITRRTPAELGWREPSRPPKTP